MRGLFGFANTGILDVDEKLSPHFNTRIYYEPSDLKKMDEDVILLPNSHILFRDLEAFKKLDCVVVVFDVPVRLDSIKGMVIQDVDKREKSFKYSFCNPNYPRFIKNVRACLETDKKVKVLSNPVNILPTLLKTSTNSSLDRLQSWKYAIKPVEVRDEIFKYVLKWFTTKDYTVKALNARLKKISPSISTDILFKDDMYTHLKEVIIQCLPSDSKRPSIVKIAEQNKVSAFDIRYILTASNVKILYDDAELYDIYEGAKHDHKQKRTA